MSSQQRHQKTFAMRFFRMKFWYRLSLAIGVVFLTCVIFLTKTLELIQLETFLHFRSNQEPMLYPIVTTDDYETNPAQTFELRNWPPRLRKINISDTEICSFAERAESNVSIKARDLFEAANPYYPWEEIDIMRKVKKQPLQNYTEKLQVVVIPHSHTDPGWLLTLEGYYQNYTSKILNLMVQKLTQHPKMTFVWSETIFLSMWWNEISQNNKDKVLEFIKQGRLEILNGGLVVPDEATTHYFALIDQLIEGHQWVEQNIGVKAKYTWAVDPFGYSSTFPYLFKKAGYDNSVILRVQTAVKSLLRDKQNLEYFWRQPWDQDGVNDVFTHTVPYILYNFKHSCGPNTAVCNQFDFRDRPQKYTQEMVESQAEKLLEMYRLRSQHFRHNVMFIPHGDDFRYNFAHEWDCVYSNMQRIFDYMNSRKDWNVEAKFGTLNDYFQLLKGSLHTNPLTNFPSLSGDFFTYMDLSGSYWSGFFTTRPYDKVLERKIESALRAAEILNTLAIAYASSNYEEFPILHRNMKALIDARWTLGLLQHHDAITGTAKNHVVIDYETRALKALESTHDVMAKTIAFLLRDKSHATKPVVFNTEFRDFLTEHDLKHKLIANHTKQKVYIINTNQTIPSQIVLYNPLPQRRQEVVRLHTSSPYVQVFNENGNIIPIQINPVWYPTGHMYTDKYELIFATDIPPLAMVVYTVKKAKKGFKKENIATVHQCHDHGLSKSTDSIFKIQEGLGDSSVLLKNHEIAAFFSPKTGMLQSIKTRSGQRISIKLDFMYYEASSSGAYLMHGFFAKYLLEDNKPPGIRVIRGPIVSEVHVIMQSAVTHAARVYHAPVEQQYGIEIINNLDLQSQTTTEIIMRFTTGVQNGGILYTDLNSFQMSARKYMSKYGTPGNYFPMTSTAYIQDQDVRFSVLTSQTHGVASLTPGTLEVMLERRCFRDDHRGLEQGILDNKPTRESFFILVEESIKMQSSIKLQETSYPSYLSKSVVHSLNYPIYHFVAGGLAYGKFIPMKKEFPCDISLVNLRNIANKNGSYNSTMLILHRHGIDCEYPTSGPSCENTNGTFVITDHFKQWNLNALQEVTLSLMYKKDKKLNLENEILHIKPMEIESYLLNFRNMV